MKRLPLDTLGEQAGIGESCWTEAGQSVRDQLCYICGPSGPSEHQREMSFLRRLMLYDDTDQSHQLEETVAGAERRDRCAHRAMWWMAAVAAVAIVGFAHSALLSEQFPPKLTQAAIRIFCALGLAALVSFLAFCAYGIFCRRQLDEQRDECRRLVARIVESRLGKSESPLSAEILQTESARRRSVVVERQESRAERKETPHEADSSTVGKQ